MRRGSRGEAATLGSVVLIFQRRFHFYFSLTGDRNSSRDVPCVKTHTEAVRGLCELTGFV